MMAMALMEVVVVLLLEWCLVSFTILEQTANMHMEDGWARQGKARLHLAHHHGDGALQLRDLGVRAL